VGPQNGKLNLERVHGQTVDNQNGLEGKTEGSGEVFFLGRTGRRRKTLPTFFKVLFLGLGSEGKKGFRGRERETCRFQD